MSMILGDASRARALQKLFAAWKLAFNRQDAEAMAAAKRAIDAVVGRTPRAADTAAVEKYVR